jgi:hypothetical protein
MKKIFAFAAAMTFAVAVMSCGPKAEQASEETAPATEEVVVDSTVAAPADTAVVVTDSTAAAH